MNLRDELDSYLAPSLSKASGLDIASAMVMPAARAEFGDYQANGVMAAARRTEQNPRQLAQSTAQLARLDALADIQVAAPGFINITLKRDFLARQLAESLRDERLGVPQAEPAQTVVVDYSHPNLAKEMHVGHLRSTIIGDAIVRALGFLGHRVVRHNHVGDWGTQFGMLIAQMDRLAGQPHRADVAAELADLEEFYRQAKQRFDQGGQFAAAARQYVVKLQSGDAHCRKVWRRFIDESLRHCQRVYGRLGVTLTPDDVRPESA